MKKIIITILALIIKAIVFTIILKYAIAFYDKNFIGWFCVYIPFFMGCESIISLIFKKK